MTSSRERLLALDVFRGMTVAAMLLVNNPGSWGAIYPPLAHAAWHGWTPTDLIFPFFLFIVGVTTHLSREARRARGDDEGALVRQVMRRATLIVLCGLLLHAFPFTPLTQFTEIRIPGVLQRIGVAYLFGALLTQRTTVKQQVGILAALLFGYWFAMTVLPVPGQAGSRRALAGRTGQDPRGVGGSRVARRTSLAAVADVGSGGGALDDAGDRHRDARGVHRALARHRAAAARAPERAVRGGGAGDDARPDVELVVPDQQGALDVELRAVHRRRGGDGAGGRSSGSPTRRGSRAGRGSSSSTARTRWWRSWVRG